MEEKSRLGYGGDIATVPACRALMTSESDGLTSIGFSSHGLGLAEQRLVVQPYLARY